jgi:ABC-type lipoprotein release transport system permease subunit
MVFGLSATDVSTIAFAIAVLVVTGLLAGLIPARRATRIDPQLALRNE